MKIWQIFRVQDHGDNSVQGFLEQVVRCWIVMSMRQEFNKIIIKLLIINNDVDGVISRT